MTSLADVMTAPKVEKALHFLHERFDHHVTRGMGTIAARARKIASWAELSAEALSELDDLIERLDEAVPAVRGLTVKNKALLDRLDDPQFRDLIYVLPKILMKKAARTRRPDAAATLARAAIAIELLLTCSMRRANLISLKLEHNIRRIGAGSNVRWVIEFEGVEVKNGQVLRYELPKESGQLLEDYLHNWRPALCTTASPWLFPAPDGRCMDARHLAGDISRKSERELGVPVTPHQFRHISAELYLRDNPDKLSVISEHLGHRDPNTARMYYARPKQREASRMYQERLGLNRSRAAGRTKQRPQRNVAGNGFDAEDLL
jgi:integrase